jgi:hypothetical protein
MVINTAKLHFDEDIARSRDILDHAAALNNSRLKDDLLRCSWMYAVGASDAFFCDAYADLIARTLRAKDRQKTGNLEGKLGNSKIPVVVFLSSNNGWRWRMAAREMIEKESVLSIKEIKDLLNSFCRTQHKLLTVETIEPWMLNLDMKQRVFGIGRHAFQNLNGNARSLAKKDGLKRLEERMQTIFQRRHDCIHNCDRPRAALQPLTASATSKAIEDIDFLVNRCTEHLRAEFPNFLTSCGFSGQTRNYVGA